MGGESNHKVLVALSSGHAAVDLVQGAVPALLPFLVERFNLSYTEAGAVVLAATMSSSVLQPVFGIVSDRHGAIWLLPVGVLLAGSGVAGTGIAPAYPFVLAAVVLGGVGVAAYHPEGAKFASYASGRRRASGMAAFNVGGNLGYALAPVLVTPCIAWLGLAGAGVVTVPTLVIAALLVLALPYLRRLVPRERKAPSQGGHDRPRAMAVLIGVVVLRSLTWFGLLTFVPLWMVAERGHSEAEGSRLLAVMLMGGLVGTVLLGPIADRVGLRPTLVATSAILGPLVGVFIYGGDAAGALALGMIGMCVVGTYGVSMVLGQMYLPHHIALAAGLNVGLALGLGGVSAFTLGAIADAVDLETALLICACTPILAFLLSLKLPDPHAPPIAARSPAAE